MTSVISHPEISAAIPKKGRRGPDLNRDAVSSQAFQACAIPGYATAAGSLENPELFLKSAISRDRVVRAILIVDDDDAILRVTEKLVRQAVGSEPTIMTAHDGKTGLLVYEMHPGLIDLVITDYNMRYMNGAEFVERLESLEVSVPILMQTSETRLPQIKSGNLTVISKDLEPESYIKLIRKLLGL